MKLPESRRGFPTYRDPSAAEPARPGPEQAESRGFRISYDDVGEGSPIVLISGFTQSGADWWELGYPDRLRALGWRVLVVDPLGHGSSDRPHDPQSYVWPDVALDVVAAMDGAGSEDQPELSRRTAEALGVELLEIPGLDHRTGLMATAAVMAFVAPFLATTTSSAPGTTLARRHPRREHPGSTKQPGVTTNESTTRWPSGPPSLVGGFVRTPSTSRGSPCRRSSTSEAPLAGDWAAFFATPAGSIYHVTFGDAD